MRGDIFAAGVIIVIGAVLLALAFGIMDSGGGTIGYDEEHTLQYGDYREIEGDVLGTSGPLEVTSYMGQQMLHAVGTGIGDVVFSDGTSVRYKAVPAEAVLAIMDGQSQAAYYGNSSHSPDPELTEGPSMPGIAWYFGYPDGMPYGKTEDVSSCRIYDFIDPLTGDLRVGDKGPLFCRTYHEETGKKVIWVSLGMPSCRILNWTPAGSGGIAWNQNLKVMTAFNEQFARTFGSNVNITKTFVMWAQGEDDSDLGNTTAYYVEHFAQFHDAAPAAWGHTIDAWYIFEGRSRNGMAGVTPEIQAALDECARLYGGGAPIITHQFIDTFTLANGLMLDGGHFSERGDNAVAIQAARVITGASGSAPVYLLQQEFEAGYGSDFRLPDYVQSFATDLRTVYMPVVWDGSADTTQLGEQIIRGTAQPTSIPLVPFAPAPIADVNVVDWGGYVYSDGVLTITMSIPSMESYPWASYAAEVATIVIDSGATDLASGSLAMLTQVTEVSIGGTLHTYSGAFGVAIKDPYGNDSAAAGDYYGTGDGTVWQLDDSLFTYSADSITGLTDSGKLAVTLVLPAEHGNTAITSIANGTSSAPTMGGGIFTKLLAVPDSGLTNIGKYAFYECYSLASVELPSGLTTIWDSAFRKCNSLTAVELPSGLTTINGYAFSGCTALTSVNLPSGLTALSANAFGGTALTSVNLPSSLTTINTNVFVGCTGTTSVSFAAGFAPATFSSTWAPAWTFYASDGTTVIGKTAASNLAGHTFEGTASALVMVS